MFASDDDVAFEGEETVMLTLTGPDSVTITNSRFEVTIIDTDGMCGNVIKCAINDVTVFINIMFFIFYFHFYEVITFGFSQVDRVATEGDGVITVEIERNRETQKPIGLVVSPVQASIQRSMVQFEASK